MSGIPYPAVTLPVTGGLVLGGQAVGLGWVAFSGVALVVVGVTLYRFGSRWRARHTVAR
jgi:hypothetical protein